MALPVNILLSYPLPSLFEYLYKPDTAYNGGMQQLQYLAWLGAMSWDDYDSLSSDVTGMLDLFFLSLSSFAVI